MPALFLMNKIGRRAMFGLLLLITSTGRSSAEHWSFVPIRRPPLPTVQRGDWALNAIDRFVLAQLEKTGRAPAQAASPAELLRRVTLDLTGLPPTPAELDAFLADQAPDAYERVLDRLLPSPRYGEHRARFWLDAARYGDTHGLHFDNERAIWPYRDWVVAAFNRNQPFDEFTMEQVAGDLLPNATIAQRVATGFHRCNVATGEEGAIPEEYRVRYAIDRVETTATVWMGLTLGCAACHDHPYDPVSQTEFYRFVAIFNQVAEPAIHDNALLPPPTVKTPSAAQSLAHQRLRQTVQPAAATTGQVAARNTEVTDDSLLSYQQQQRLRRLESAFSGTMVMRDLSRPRPTYELIRGQYDQPAQQVAPDVPDFLPSLPEASRPNRLALARWLVRDDHPLTARVAVNHFWQQYFGIGIVETSEDFGIEGALPSHPQLLDWLAAEFIESGWNVKALQRLIVSSATYRQSAFVTEQAYRQDPHNRSLARGPRYRMDAEMIRDQALFAGGLLVEQLGGRGVKPYQPAGVWEAVAHPLSNTAHYDQGHGEELYRRSLYTFWKRTAPPPAMQILDAPSRETCRVRRSRTNTPSAALLMMNDIPFIEAARKLAENLQQPRELNDAQRLANMFCRLTARDPDPVERTELKRVLQQFRQQYAADPAAAKQLLRVGESPVSSAITTDDQELTAWTMVASLLLNLDETITK